MVKPDFPDTEPSSEKEIPRKTLSELEENTFLDYTTGVYLLETDSEPGYRCVVLIRPSSEEPFSQGKYHDMERKTYSFPVSPEDLNSAFLLKDSFKRFGVAPVVSTLLPNKTFRHVYDPKYKGIVLGNIIGLAASLGGHESK